MHYLLFYKFAPDYLQRREGFRAEHLALAWQSHARRELVLGGVLADPIDGAMVLFEVDSPSVIESYVAADPYVTNGLVTHWYIRPWNTVVGEQSTTPIKSI